MQGFPGGMFYYHFDGLGSVVALSDVNGVKAEYYKYDVYGGTTIRDPNGEILDTSDVGNPYMFTGRRFDSETSLYYYRARYYDPYIGRFMSSDPLGTVPDGDWGNPFDPFTQYEDGMNLYTYVGNNPINYVDQLGLTSKLDNCIKECKGRKKWCRLRGRIICRFVVGKKFGKSAARICKKVYFWVCKKDYEICVKKCRKKYECK